MTLTIKQVELLIVIITQRLKDWHCTKGALQCLLAIVKNHTDKIRENVGDEDKKSLIERIFLDANTIVHAPSFAQPVRQSMLELLIFMVTNFSKELENLCPILLDQVMQQCEDEKDPRNLALVFPLIALIFKTYPQHVGKTQADRAADILTAYYPITYKASANDPFAISEVLIKEALNLAMASHVKLAPEVIPFFLECLRLASEPSPVQVTETVDLTLQCLRTYGAAQALPFIPECLNLIDEEGTLITPGIRSLPAPAAPPTSDFRAILANNVKATNIFNANLPELLRLFGGIVMIASNLTGSSPQNSKELLMSERVLKRQGVESALMKFSAAIWSSIISTSASSTPLRFEVNLQMMRVISDQSSKLNSCTSLLPEVLGELLVKWTACASKLLSVYLGDQLDDEDENSSPCRVSDDQQCCKGGSKRDGLCNRGDSSQANDSKTPESGCCGGGDAKEGGLNSGGGCCGGNTSSLLHKVHQIPLGKQIPSSVPISVLNRTLSVVYLLAIAVSESETRVEMHDKYLSHVMNLVELILSKGGSNLLFLNPDMCLSVVRLLTACISHTSAESTVSNRAAQMCLALLPGFEVEDGISPEIIDLKMYLTKHIKPVTDDSAEFPVNIYKLVNTENCSANQHQQIILLISTVYSAMKTCLSPPQLISKTLQNARINLKKKAAKDHELLAFFFASEIASLHQNLLPLLIEPLLNTLSQNENFDNERVLSLEIRVASQAVLHLSDLSDESLSTMTKHYDLSQLIRKIPSLKISQQQSQVASLLTVLALPLLPSLLPSLLPQEGCTPSSFSTLASFFASPSSHLKGAWESLPFEERTRAIRLAFSLIDNQSEDENAPHLLFLSGALSFASDEKESREMISSTLKPLGLSKSASDMIHSLSAPKFPKSHSHTLTKLAANALRGAFSSQPEMAMSVVEDLVLNFSANPEVSQEIRCNAFHVIQDLLPLSELLSTEISRSSGSNCKPVSVIENLTKPSLTSGLGKEHIEAIAVRLVPLGVKKTASIVSSPAVAITLLGGLSSILAVCPLETITENGELLTAVRSILASGCFLIGTKDNCHLEDEELRSVKIKLSTSIAYLNYRLICAAASKNLSDGLQILRKMFTDSTEGFINRTLDILSLLQEDVDVLQSEMTTSVAQVPPPISTLSCILLVDFLNVFITLDRLNNTLLKSLVGDVWRGLEGATRSPSKLVRRAAGVCRANWMCIAA
eukprot:GDKJ01023148.1.p1 GENE.GDKJ01023148.1~~GDKJ01023148.1.p1  ORF type:complete len:1300 (-),score=338.57 GDKJ01023148.1:66-3704(-)